MPRRALHIEGHSALEPVFWADMPYLDRARVNGALGPLRNITALSLIGAPRGTFNPECQDVTNPDLLALIASADLGRFRAVGLRPALSAIRRALDEAAVQLPELMAHVGIDRMLCCRYVRGSDAVVSPHAWGLAIDLTIDGNTDWPAASAPRGLLELHRIFRSHGFYWGAAFTRPEVLHFEASDQVVRRWSREGYFGTRAAKRLPRGFVFSDRGPEVEALQTDLNAQLPIEIEVDGLFGRDTRAAVFEFQRRAGIEPDGMAGPPTLKALARMGM